MGPQHIGAAIQLLSTPYVHFWGGLPLHIGRFKIFWIENWGVISLLNLEEKVYILVLGDIFEQFRS